MLEYYAGIVLAMAEWKHVTFEMALCKPRVREANRSQAGSVRIKAVEEMRKIRAIRKVLKDNPQLAAKYSTDDYGVRTGSCVPAATC